MSGPLKTSKQIYEEGAGNLYLHGAWNASTNVPVLSDATGRKGDAYRISTTGTRDLGSGSVIYNAGSLVYHDGTIFRRLGAQNSHGVFAAGKFTTAGGDAAETVPVTGLLSTDVVIVTVQTAGSTPRSMVAAVPAAGQINVTMSGDPSTDHILAYVAFRV